MARKIFVSYKHSDDSVEPLNYETTARAYVDEIMDLFEGDEIYKGEGNEDLSEFKDDTIATHLKDKIYDSSITLVLISPIMKDDNEKESDQWIPWEISYSLKEISRGGRMSRTNGVLAVVLPDRSSSYDYYIQDDTCSHCHCRTLLTNRLFQILRDNMFNLKDPEFNDCPHHAANNPVYTGASSYIYSVKWRDFIADKEKFIGDAENLRENVHDYEICKIVKE